MTEDREYHVGQMQALARRVTQHAKAIGLTSVFRYECRGYTVTIAPSVKGELDAD
jgi:hypothetical protein